MLTKDVKWWSDEDGSDESSRRGHGCGKSQGGTNDGGGSMSCRADSIRKSDRRLAHLPTTLSWSSAMIMTRTAIARGEGGKGHGHVGKRGGEIVVGEIVVGAAVGFERAEKNTSSFERAEISSLSPQLFSG